MSAPHSLPPNESALDVIWDLRLCGHAVEARERFVEFIRRGAFALSASPAARWEELRHRAGWSESAAVRFLALEISFLRHRLALEQAELRVLETRRVLNDAGVVATFDLPFQAGLNALCNSDFPRALESFLEARRRAPAPRERLCAAFNVLLCLENLGLDFRAQLAEFLAEFTSYEHAYWAKPITEQTRALEMRAAFRAGDLDALERLTSGTAAAGDQHCYFSLWVASLPYLALAQAPEPEALGKLCERASRYLVPFRLRTLRGLFVEEDATSEVRLADRIERFYLWVWDWLVRPEPARLDRLLRWRASLQASLRGHLAPEDFRLLENAQRWLGLFLGTEDSLSRGAVGDATPSLGQTLPILDYESRLLDWLVARRDGDEEARARAFRALPAAPASDVRFLLPRLLESQDVPPQLVALEEALRGVGHSPYTSEDGTPIVVKFLGRTIRIKNAGQRDELVRSRSLSLLLFCFRTRDAVHAAEALKACFDFNRYDPLIHDPKIANLLSRANRLFKPHVRFLRRDDYLYAEGVAERVSFRDDAIHSMQLARRADAFDFLGATRHPPQEAAETAAPSGLRLPSGWIERAELQRWIGIPRSSLLRRLKRWEQASWIERRGLGKAIRYRIKAELEPELASLWEERRR